MSRPTWLVVYVSCLVACASGGRSGDDQPTKLDAASVPRDTSTSATSDAAHNEAAMVDAAQSIDAPSGPFCSANAQCTASGECCITLGGPLGFCGKGIIVFGQCVPQ